MIQGTCGYVVHRDYVADTVSKDYVHQYVYSVTVQVSLTTVHK